MSTISEDTNTTARAAPATCTVEGCSNEVVARGWCGKHYRRWKRHGSTEPTRMSNQGKECSVPGCGNPASKKALCAMHYTRQWLHGDVGGPEPQTGLSAHERAMRMVDDSAGPDACHPWAGPVNSTNLPLIYVGPREERTTRSARRVIAHHAGVLDDDEDQGWWIRMRESCDPLCCNVRHMEATNTDRFGTRKGA